jgi:predicted ATPase
MSLEVADWLQRMGLEQYASAFRDIAIDAAVLPSLTAEDLKDLGITLVGHRRRLLEAIAALKPDAGSRADPGAIVGLAKAAAGDINGAHAMFDVGLEAASTTGERWYEPELLRFKAEVLLAQPKQRATAAEQCLKAAIALAQQQEAKLWELRACAALAKLWAQQGRRNEGHDLLAPLYSGFTEGFDTTDLKDAKNLLQVLA